MDAPSANHKPDEGPASQVEGVLWKLAAEKPECREIVFSLITHIRQGLKTSCNNAAPAEGDERARLIGAKIKALRKKKRLSQQQVADHLGVIQSNISAFELRGSGISIEKHLSKLAEILEVEPSEITNV
jgi:DNA-binding transcriptional regulator YiaG